MKYESKRERYLRHVRQGNAKPTVVYPPTVGIITGVQKHLTPRLASKHTWRLPAGAKKVR